MTTDYEDGAGRKPRERVTHLRRLVEAPELPPAVWCGETGNGGYPTTGDPTVATCRACQRAAVVAEPSGPVPVRVRTVGPRFGSAEAYALREQMRQFGVGADPPIGSPPAPLGDSEIDLLDPPIGLTRPSADVVLQEPHAEVRAVVRRAAWALNELPDDPEERTIRLLKITGDILGGLDYVLDIMEQKGLT